MSTGKYFSGILAGMAIGTIAGILLAPEKGSETRKNIMKGGDDLANDIKGKVNHFTGLIKESIHTAKKNVGDTVAKGESKFAGAKRSIHQS